MIAVRHFLDRWFGDSTGGVIWGVATPSGQQIHVRPGDWHDLGAFTTHAVRQRQDVRYGHATRRDDSSGRGDNLREWFGIVADLDRPLAQIRDDFATFPFRWSFLINSGLYNQAYWQWKEPEDISTMTAFQEAARLTRRFGAHVDSDPRALSPALAPRLPGTFNWKYGAPRPVTILEATGCVYRPSEFDAFLPAEIVRRNAMTIRSSIPAEESRSTIPIHTRNDTLYTLTRSLRCAGMPFNAITVAVEAINEKICDPPLPDREIRALLYHALTQPNRRGFDVPVPRPIVHDAEAEEEATVPVPGTYTGTGTGSR